jgi:hypothetical protein
MTAQTQNIVVEIVDGPNLGDDDGWTHYAFRLRLKYDGRTMTVPWRQGIGIQTNPTAEDVMESLLSDAAGFDNARSFEDWAAEYGYDTDSRKAEKIYRSVETQTIKLARFLGNEYQSAVFPEA